ncbi:MAG: hypothetical protein HY673_17125 [Chloroflexi bacterium]|nr:hypothetical protein [Chloroflexota bacterium]
MGPGAQPAIVIGTLIPGPVAGDVVDIDIVKNVSEQGGAFDVCPYCGEELKLPKPPKFCPYCREKLATEG